jgi:hypothetical protein
MIQQNSRFFIRKATTDDAAYVARNLRPHDHDEVRALTGVSPSFVLPAYVEDGREVYVAGLPDNVPQVIWGADPIEGVDRAAVVWLLSTPVMYHHAQLFIPMSKKLWDGFHERYDLLTNFTDARNTRHHKWLQWLGAVFLRRVEHFGAESRPFLEFASLRCA